ncbi:MAG: LysM peptidoglycan-binding domain-containing protein [Rhodospirillales bacterium]|nr:LysM peptidoglycan-binding domain-containing protein [Rhodospirillales bacterium]
MQTHLLALLFAITLAGPMQACPIISVNARSGDTLATIARRYGTTSSAIVAVNRGHALTPLLPGQTISVPACRPVRPRWPSGPIGPRTRVTSR